MVEGYMMIRRRKMTQQNKPQVQAAPQAQAAAKVDPKVEAKKSAKKAKKEARKAVRKEARTRVLAFVQENLEQLGTLANDIKSLVGGTGQRIAVAGTGTKAKIREALVAAGTKGLSEMDVFKAYQIGRPEMHKNIRAFLKVPDKTQRVWVALVGETYKVLGTGEKAPEGWDGFIPTDEVDL